MKLLSFLTVAALTAFVNAAAIGEMHPAVPAAPSTPQSRPENPLEARGEDSCGQMCFGPGECRGTCSKCDLKFSKCTGQF